MRSSTTICQGLSGTALHGCTTSACRALTSCRRRDAFGGTARTQKGMQARRKASSASAQLEGDWAQWASKACDAVTPMPRPAIPSAAVAPPTLTHGRLYFLPASRTLHAKPMCSRYSGGCGRAGDRQGRQCNTGYRHAVLRKQLA